MDFSLSHGVFSLRYGALSAGFPGSRLTLLTFLACSDAGLRAWRWRSDTACERALRYHVGEKIHGFTVGQVGARPAVRILCGPPDGRAGGPSDQRLDNCHLVSPGPGLAPLPLEVLA